MGSHWSARVGAGLADGHRGVPAVGHDVQAHLPARRRARTAIIRRSVLMEISSARAALYRIAQRHISSVSVTMARQE